MLVYVNAVYIKIERENFFIYAILLSIGIVYPMVYDLTQLYKMGITTYFKDVQNFSDQLYIWCSVLNLITQNFSDSQALHNKVLMTIIFLQQIIKSFFYLRIFKSLSYIVTMIYTVMADL